ncbi:MAG: hypothetical protein GY708_12935 [Actinomycetia bacterium]|nr:hypothetical protein [Actinomycetes bacterium]
MFVVIAGLVLLARVRRLRVVSIPLVVGLTFGQLWAGILTLDILLIWRVSTVLVARRQSSRTLKGLPELADEAARRMGAGQQLTHALAARAQLVPGIRGELESVLRGLELGLPYVDALGPLRSHSEVDVRFLGASIELAADRVSDAEPTFAAAARTLRERRLRRGEISAQAAQATASALALAVLPWGAAVLGGFGGDGLSALWTSVNIRSTTLSGVALSLVGTLWSLHLIKMVERAT